LGNCPTRPYRCDRNLLAPFMSARGRAGRRKAGCVPGLGVCRSPSGAAAFGPTSGKVMAAPHGGIFVRCVYGGARIARLGQRPSYRPGRLDPQMRGAKTRNTAATIGLSIGRPMNQAIGFGARIACTTSSSRSITTPARVLRGAAALCSSIWRGPAWRRPPAALP
jgi:hypothetical protein